jgi:hypothetical protein
MATPKSIIVAPYAIELRPDVAASQVSGADGAFLEAPGLIIFDPRLGPMALRERLWHEAKHAVWSQTHLAIKVKDADEDSLGEEIIRTLSPRELALMRDNPQFMRWLMGAV